MENEEKKNEELGFPEPEVVNTSTPTDEEPKVEEPTPTIETPEVKEEVTTVPEEKKEDNSFNEGNTMEITNLIAPELVEKQNKKKSHWKLYLIVGTITLIIIAGMSFIFFMSRGSYADNTLDLDLGEGYRINEVYNILEKHGVVRSAFCARLWAKVSGQTDYKLGKYTIPKNISAFEVVKLLATTDPSK